MLDLGLDAQEKEDKHFVICNGSYTGSVECLYDRASSCFVGDQS